MLSSSEKKIAFSIKPITQEEAFNDFKKLVALNVTKKDLNKLIGNKFVDYYTFAYRLDSICSKRKIDNFYEFYKNPKKYLTPKRYKFAEDIIHTSMMNENYDRINAIYEFYRHYMCSISTFKPIVAKYLYELYKPHTILDISIGWGGRLVGALSLPNIKYIGFDTNKDLKIPYTKMITDLNVKDRVKLIFKDSSKSDFSKYTYDMVFTSPPYYSKNVLLEKYNYMPIYKDYEDWVNRFFNPVMINAWNHMVIGGTFCINTNSEGFGLLKQLFGKPNNKIDIHVTLAHRIKSDANPHIEYIYVWIKK